MEIRDGPEGPDGPVLYISYCARHARPQPHLSGEPLVHAPPCLLLHVSGIQLFVQPGIQLFVQPNSCRKVGTPAYCCGASPLGRAGPSWRCGFPGEGPGQSWHRSEV